MKSRSQEIRESESQGVKERPCPCPCPCRCRRPLRFRCRRCCCCRRPRAVFATSVGELGELGGVGGVGEVGEVGVTPKVDEVGEVAPSAQLGPGRSPLRSEIPTLALTLVLAPALAPALTLPLPLAPAQVHTNERFAAARLLASRPPLAILLQPAAGSRQSAVGALQPAVCGRRFPARSLRSVVCGLREPPHFPSRIVLARAGTGQDRTGRAGTGHDSSRPGSRVLTQTPLTLQILQVAACDSTCRPDLPEPPFLGMLPPAACLLPPAACIMQPTPTAWAISDLLLHAEPQFGIEIGAGIRVSSLECGFQTLDSSWRRAVAEARSMRR